MSNYRNNCEKSLKELEEKYNITMSTIEIKRKYFPDGFWVNALSKYEDDDYVLGLIAYYLLKSYHDLKK